jgi:hypothetical protein
MIKNIVWSIVLGLAGTSVSSNAQVGFHIGGHGVSVSIGAARAPRVSCAPPVTCEPARYREVRERVYVDGYWEERSCPAEYAWRIDACGHRVRVCVRPAHVDRVWVPGRWEWRTRQVVVPAHRGHGYKHRR